MLQSYIKIRYQNKIIYLYKIVGGIYMEKVKKDILRKIFLGFIHIHILRHAYKKPFYGSWLINHLAKHGYIVSAGTIYPILYKLEENKVLMANKTLEKDGKFRIYYSITSLGIEILKEAEYQVKILANKSLEL